MGIVDSAVGAGFALASGDPASSITASIGLVLELMKAERDARLGRWWRRIIADPGWEAPQEVQGIIEQRLKDDPTARDTVWQAAKRVVEMPNDESIEVIGSITAEYLRDKKEVDAFFRGSVRLLADLTPGEFGDLKRIASMLVNYLTDAVHFYADKNNSVFVSRYGKRLGTTQESPHERLGTTQTLDSDMVRMIRLLKEHDFTTAAEGAGPTDKIRFLAVAPEPFRRLCYHLGVKGTM